MYYYYSSVPCFANQQVYFCKSSIQHRCCRSVFIDSQPKASTLEAGPGRDVQSSLWVPFEASSPDGSSSSYSPPARHVRQMFWRRWTRAQTAWERSGSVSSVSIGPAAVLKGRLTQRRPRQPEHARVLSSSGWQIVSLCSTQVFAVRPLLGSSWFDSHFREFQVPTQSIQVTEDWTQLF